MRLISWTLRSGSEHVQYIYRAKCVNSAPVEIGLKLFCYTSDYSSNAHHLLFCIPEGDGQS